MPAIKKPIYRLAGFWISFILTVTNEDDVVIFNIREAW
jgi:hypothetical protein